MPATGELAVTCFVVGCVTAAIAAGFTAAALAVIIHRTKEKEGNP